MNWLTTMIINLIKDGKVEEAIDKKGRAFHRAVIQDGIQIRRPNLTIKSMVWYVADGHIRILTNLGGTNKYSGNSWARSMSVTLKEVNPYFILVLNGKQKYVAPRRGWGSYEHVAYGDSRPFNDDSQESTYNYDDCF